MRFVEAEKSQKEGKDEETHGKDEETHGIIVLQ